MGSFEQGRSRFRGDITGRLDRMMRRQQRLKIAFSVFPAIDQRHDMIALPRFAGMDFAVAAALATPLECLEYPQPDAGRNGGVIGAADPFRKHARHGLMFPVADSLMHERIATVNPQAYDVYPLLNHQRGIARIMSNNVQVSAMLTATQIKEVRLGLGESQQAFARRLGVAQPTLFRWETKGLPSSVLRLVKAAAIIAALGRRKRRRRNVWTIRP